MKFQSIKNLWNSKKFRVSWKYPFSIKLPLNLHDLLWRSLPPVFLKSRFPLQVLSMSDQKKDKTKFDKAVDQ